VGPTVGLEEVMKRKNSQPMQGLEPSITQRYTTEQSGLLL